MRAKQPVTEAHEQTAIARKRILALESKVSEQVDQYTDAWLAESDRPSTVQEETGEELAARRKAAKRKAEKWKADAQRRSGFLGLFSDSLREAIDHIDALEDEAVRSSLMVNLGFLLVASNNAGALAGELAVEIRKREALWLGWGTPKTGGEARQAVRRRRADLARKGPE